MLSITDIRLEAVATHFVGNRANGDQLQLSKELHELEEGVRPLLLQYFLTPFQEAATWHFWHQTDLALHELFQFAKAVFNNPEELLLQSCNMARHLYEYMDLPNIKSCELHVALFRGCPVNGLMVDAIGLYKTESKDAYLKLQETKRGFSFQADEGINPNKMDKGCLIFNVEEEEGFRVHIVDKTNKNSEAQFWKDHFLKVRAAADEFHHTNDYMKMCKEFIVDHMPTEYDLTKVDQIDFLNRSVNYFKKNEVFDKEEFKSQVFMQQDLIDSFKQYETTYNEDYGLELPDQFNISDAALKKQARIFKSVLKLDKNFHIYIHGNRDLIEKGFDAQTGMNYYKIYFEEEE